MISANNRVGWYVGLNRTAFVLAFGGMLAIGTGIYCLPYPIANPMAFTSLFHFLAGSGSSYAKLASTSQSAAFLWLFQAKSCLRFVLHSLVEAGNSWIRIRRRARKLSTTSRRPESSHWSPSASGAEPAFRGIFCRLTSFGSSIRRVPARSGRWLRSLDRPEAVICWMRLEQHILES